MSQSDALAERPSYEDLVALVAELRALVAVQAGEIAELRARLDANSSNSSKPPSSEGYAKPRADSKDKTKRSLRRSSGRKQGGQDGHHGARLEPVEVPDRQVEHSPERCDGCAGDLADAELLPGGERRQVFDMPEGPPLRVVEHLAELRRCECGCVSAGVFPDAVAAPTQYGPRIRAFGVYLHVFQHLPYERACRALGDLAGAQVSTATLTSWVAAAAAGLTDFDERLRELLVASPIVHFDETGARIADRLGWIHSASTADLTRYTAHRRRGCEAMDDAGVLPGFEGVAVHDGWKPYRSYEGCEHALCNPHHLRELVAATEAGHAWPARMSALLLEANTTVEAARAVGEQTLSAEALDAIVQRYRAILADGAAEHPPVPGKKAKKTKAHNLLLRLQRDQAQTLRFAHDFRVPFSNNQAEQDIRMVKLQQKISGCWRTTDGADRFLRIRSYLSSARKNGMGALDSLNRLTAGEPWLPQAAPP